MYNGNVLILVTFISLSTPFLTLSFQVIALLRLIFYFHQFLYKKNPCKCQKALTLYMNAR